MDLLIELNNRIAKSVEYESFIKWLETGSLVKLRKTIKDELGDAVTDTHSGLRDLQNIIDLYNFAKTTGNELAFELLHAKLRKETSLIQLGEDLINDLKAKACERKFLEGWTLGKKIGAGAQGYIQEVTDAKGQKAILKRSLENTAYYEEMQIPPADETVIATKAGELGVGPRVYKAGRCPVSEKKAYVYLIQQRLSGPDLDKIYPLDPAYVTAALDAYLVFLNNTPWEHGDLHHGNIMYDNGRVYIIDYGMAEDRKGTICEALRMGCITLIQSFVSTPWQKETDKTKALKDFLTMANTISTWYFTKCPAEPKPLIQDHKQNGIPYRDFGLTTWPPPVELEPWLHISS